jgi:hypothetical protein
VANARAAGIEARVGWLLALPANVGHFDLVILSHVLEHVPDLQGAAAAVAAATAPGGHVYVEVPDPLRYVDFLYAPFQEFNTEHINHFTHGCLANLLRPVGLEPVHEAAKVFETPAGVVYPAIYGLYRRGIPSGPLQSVPDLLLAERLEAYVAESRVMMSRMDACIRAVLRESSAILVWGTGQLVMKLLAETALGDASIAAFVDSSPKQQGRVIRGVPVLAPLQARDLPHPIVIGTTLYQEEIADAIRTRWQMPNPIVKLRDPKKTAS